MPQPELLDSHEPLPTGYVSTTCSFVDDGPQRLVLLNGQPTYCYDRNDQELTRQVWALVYESGLATYRQIASATGIARRSLQYWVKRYREEGMAGLADRHRSGAPRKVTEQMRKKICRLRDRRLTLREIARRCQISQTAVARVLSERRQAAEARQEKLDLPVEPTEPIGAEPPPDNSTDEASGPDAKDIVVPDSSAEDSSAATPVEPSALPAMAWDDKVEAAMAGDRQSDRLLAAAGMLQDAEPLFAPCEHLEFAGAFLAIAAVAADPFLDLGKRAYGNFRAAFYGVRTILVSLVTMALLRIKRPENLRRFNPVKLGRIFGLDRVPEVKTLRRNLFRIETIGKAASLMRDLAAARIRSYDGPVKIVHVDGHTRVYSGKAKVGEVYSSRCSKVVKGQTDNWVNLPGRFPVMAIGSDFNQGLNRVLPDVLAKARQAMGTESFCCCFDRGGSNALVFEELLEDGYQILTYRKGPFELVSDSRFRSEPTLIGGRQYKYAPYETEAILPVYEVVDRGSSRKFGRRNTGRTVTLRDIRILREDGGQTSILTSLPADELSAVDAAAAIFDRIGSQENIFKYMRAEFDLDGLVCYGVEEVDETLTHPNPAYVKLEKRATKLRRQRDRLFGKYAEELTGLDAEAGLARLHKLRSELAAASESDGSSPTKKADALRRDADRLADISRRLDEVAKERAETPEREKVSAAGYKRLKNELSMFMNAVKISAYHIETGLVDLIADHYSNTEKEGRSVIAAALRSSGSLRLQPGRLVIRLEPQGEPRRTRAINHLAAELTRRQVRYPGSQRVIVFEPTPVSPPPASLAPAAAAESAK